MKLTCIVENGAIKLPADTHLPDGKVVTVIFGNEDGTAEKRHREAHRKASLTPKDKVPGLPAGLCVPPPG
jgi:hypothetical protein